MSKRLCIIPCGSAKIWDKEPNAGPTQAQFVYTGVFAMACQRYAKAYFKDWVIFSAKYGFLFPDDIINESYNVSFIKPSDETIGVDRLKEQAMQKELNYYQEIVVLGGKHYVDRIKAVFCQGQQIVLPLSNSKGIGYMLQKLTRAIDDKVEIEENTVAFKSKETPIVATRHKPSTQVGKYSALFDYLKNFDGEQVELTYGQTENILGFPLPASAHKHRPWWANTITNSQAKAWLLADWEVDMVQLTSSVRFRKYME